ncbi:MAG: helix-turn-helix transcriptional regulator [Methylophilus sp.]|jgi:DNA-binding XRE family transcriptional regulator|nr:helix-turn-helix transcriptional regulator [Methylophilus sp.]
MPKKIPENAPIHPFALDKISMWGRAISAQRKLRRITMRDFAHRANISLNTLQRIERGEHSVLAGNYLNAMWVLGILDKLCITPDHSMMVSYVERVRVVRGDPDYF